MMRPLSALELLDLWEQGRSHSSLQQALLLLSAACPEQTLEALAALPIGQRDRLLFDLREWTFGAHLKSVVSCPACSERLEFTFEHADLLADQATPPAKSVAIEADGYIARFRLPNSLDLASIVGYTDQAAARRRLLALCLVELSQYTVPDDTEEVLPALTLEQLPARLHPLIEERMSAADPLADIQLALTCPACAHRWSALFDIVTFFWQEIDDWAQRTLREVHLLASAYGWRETDILEMSAWRRRFYLGMVSG